MSTVTKKELAQEIFMELAPTLVASGIEARSNCDAKDDPSHNCLDVTKKHADELADFCFLVATSFAERADK